MRIRPVLLLLLALGPTLLEAAGEGKSLPERYRRWMEEEVDTILSDVEREAFLKLTDDPTRELFLRAFWEARDPTPGTPRNEFRDEHYKRIADANRLFGQGRKRPGSRTPRGRVYIQLGPPQDRTSYPMEAQLYPIEDWFYQGDPKAGFPSFFHVLFFRPYGAGDYEIYSPISDGPEKLVGGSPGAVLDRFEALRVLRNVSSELQVASLNLITAEPINVDSGRASPASERLVGKIRDFPNAHPPDTRYVERVLGQKGLVEVEYSFRSLGMRGHFQGGWSRDGGTVLHYAIEIPPESLTLERYGERISGALQVAGRIFTAEGSTPVLELDERVDVELSMAQFDQVRQSPFAFEDVVPLLPGRYQANLVVRNLVTKEFGVVDGRFEVPEPPSPGAISLGPILIAAGSTPGSDEAGRPFAFGDRGWYPSTGQVVPLKGEIEAVFQVAYTPAEHALGDELKTRFELLAGSEVKAAGFGRVKLNPVYDRGVAVGTARLGLGQTPSGDYQFRVTVTGGARESAVRTTPLTVRFDPPSTAPWIYTRKKPRSAGEARLVLAHQALARGNEVLGLALLERLAADPLAEAERRDAALRLAELRIRRKEFARAAELLQPLAGGESPVAEAVTLLALAQSGQGLHADAIASYERALAAAPRSTRLLNALAEELLRAGTRPRAAELLRRSLELDPDQPRAIELLASLEPAAAP